MSSPTATQFNVQVTTGPRADRPDPVGPPGIPGGDFYLANDTQELFLLMRDPAGIIAPQWILIETSTTSGGEVRTIRYAIGTGATQDSLHTIPANAVVLYAAVEIVTPYSMGATIEVGNPGVLNLLLDTPDVDPTTSFLYDAVQSTEWGGTEQVVRTTVGGGPVAGDGFVTVTFSVPEN